MLNNTIIKKIAAYLLSAATTLSMANVTYFAAEGDNSGANAQGTSVAIVDIINEAAQEAGENQEENQEVNVDRVISTSQELVDFANEVNLGNSFQGKTIVLKNNIDMDNREDFNPIGTKNNEFEGTFDGQDYTISNLKCEKPTQDDVGLFGVVGAGGTVKNVKIENGSIEGDGYVGGIAGFNNKGTIESCTYSGTVEGKEVVGGNVGGNRGTVKDCTNNGTVKGKEDVGGNVGYNRGTVSEECTNNGNVTGQHFVGGNVGYNQGVISMGCTNSGAVTGTEYVGGNVGYNNGTVSGECTNNGNVSGISNVKGNVGFNGGEVSGQLTNTGRVIQNGIVIDPGTPTSAADVPIQQNTDQQQSDDSNTDSSSVSTGDSSFVVASSSSSTTTTTTTTSSSQAATLSSVATGTTTTSATGTNASTLSGDRELLGVTTSNNNTMQLTVDVEKIADTKVLSNKVKDIFKDKDAICLDFSSNGKYGEILSVNYNLGKAMSDRNLVVYYIYGNNASLLGDLKVDKDGSIKITADHGATYILMSKNDTQENINKVTQALIDAYLNK